MHFTPKTINIFIGIGVAIVAIIVLMGIFTIVSNQAISKEETVETSKSNISTEEQRRVDLFNNLVDAVQSYNQFESSTLEKVIAARQQANSGKIENAQLTLAAVVEAYPQLKSQENYKQAMLEFSITENRLAAHRKQYTTDVQDYTQFVRSQPQRFFLGLMGYEKKEYKRLDFNVDNTKARDLFK